MEWLNIMTKYPNTLSATLSDLVDNERYNVNDALDAAQFLFSEYKLTGSITHKMRTDVLDLLVNNGAQRYATK